MKKSIRTLHSTILLSTRARLPTHVCICMNFREKKCSLLRTPFLTFAIFHPIATPKFCILLSCTLMPISQCLDLLRKTNHHPPLLVGLDQDLSPAVLRAQSFRRLLANDLRWQRDHGAQELRFEESDSKEKEPSPRSPRSPGEDFFQTKKQRFWEKCVGKSADFSMKKNQSCCVLAINPLPTTNNHNLGQDSSQKNLKAQPD